MEENIIWIGPRISDIVDDNMFFGGITTFGFDQYSYCQQNYKRINRGTKDETRFVLEKMNELHSNNPKYRYLLYDQSEAEKYKTYSPNLICVNDSSLINALNSKQFTRSWLSNTVDCLPFIVMPFSDCDYLHLCRRFPGIKSFIVQNIYGVGGTKTYIIKSEKDLQIVKKYNKPYEICIVSPYMEEALSLNMHLLCSHAGTILFPYSTQIIKIYNGCLLYVGSDFTRHYNPTIEQKIYATSTFIGNKLCNMGYKGIVGIDFLLTNNVLYFMEINPRFQGSTRILNIWLKERHYPSIYQMNLDIFNGGTVNYNFSNCHIPYISYNFLSGLKNDYTIPPNSILTYCDEDGWKQNVRCEDGVYMYRNIYKLIQ